MAERVARLALLVPAEGIELDAALARLIEPYAPRPELRMEAVRALVEAGIAAGVSLSPIQPLINDTQESINAVIERAAQAGAQWVWHNVLFLKPCARAALSRVSSFK